MRALRKLLLVLGGIAMSICLPGTASAQSNLEAQRAAVVKLRIHRAGQADETAAGLYVGKDQQSAYFITAYHAIGPNSRGVPVQSVQLQFYASPHNFSASVFENYDEVLDLGVMSIAVANLPPDLSKIERRDPAVAPIRVIGHPAGGVWTVWSGNVENENASVTDIHRFITNKDDSLGEGFSGGPVLDSDGAFLGMHTSNDRRYGFATKSSDIVGQLKAWRVPTNNLITGAGVDGGDGSKAQQAAVDSIKMVLNRYEDAYNHTDAKALWRIWPNPPAKTKQAIEAYFKSAASIRASLRQGMPEIAATHVEATVTGQFSQRFTPREGNPPPARDEEIVFTLKKNDGVWTIVDVK